MSTSLLRQNQFNIQKLLHSKNNKIQSQWLPVLLFKLMGYSSFAAAIVSMIVYWHKKQQQQQKLQLPNRSTEAAIRHKLDEEDELLHMNPRKKLHITTSNAMMMKRSSSSLSNLHQHARRTSLMTPPPSPIPSSSYQDRCGSTSPTSPRSLSPRSWSSRLLEGVISATRKRKRMTISLKNTILWNPSPDVNTPMHAFHENTVLLLNQLVQLYDIYVMIHITSDQERHQIHQLLNNANLLIDPRKVLYCSSEQGKLHLIKHIQPAIHVEGGWELDDGSLIMEQLAASVEQKIWISKKNVQIDHDESIEYADNILKTCLAKQAGFEQQ